MEIEAIYDHGRVELPKGLRLRHQRFRLRVEIPDDEVEAGGEAEGAATDARDTHEPVPGSFLAEMNAILAPVRQQLESSANQSLSKEERRDLFYREWQERHRDGG